MMNRDLEFLYEIATMRNMPRGWRQHLGTDCANVLDHTIRVIWLAIILGRMEGGVDENKIIKMALVHDAAETRTSDLSYVQKVYVKEDEKAAAVDMFENTSLEDYQSEILTEYMARESMEAKIVKDADNLDIDLEGKELEERGSKLPTKWGHLRKFVCDEKLYTKSAKTMWDEIQSSDVSSWHLNMNKWLKVPEAGK